MRQRSFFMSTLNWIVFIAVLAGLYLFNVAMDRSIHKQWKFKISSLAFIFMALISLVAVNLSDMFVDEYVKKNVPNEWQEQVLSTQQVEDVVRSREKEGSFFFGIGDVTERETFRYAVVNEDGSRVRDKLYVSQCYILKAQDKKQKILYLRNVRVYKNPEDKKFFQNSYDKTSGFYRVYLL